MVQNEVEDRVRNKEEEEVADRQIEEEPVRRTEMKTEQTSMKAVSGGSEKLLNMKRNR